MYARVVTNPVQSGKMDEALQLLRESVLPETRQQRGFQRVMVNGNKVDVQWISIYRLADGKIIEHRDVMDMLGLPQQLGTIPPAQ